MPIFLAQISPSAGAAKNVEFFLSVCLSVCLSVRHTYVNAASVFQVAPVVLREFYYLFPLKIVVRNLLLG